MTEKLLSCGPDALSDIELLAILLRTGIQGKGLLELARRAMAQKLQERDATQRYFIAKIFWLVSAFHSYCIQYALMHTQGGLSMNIISATELTRNTREILDRVVTRGETVTIERNHTVIAQLMPPQKTMTASQALAGLVFPTMTPQQGSSWLQESKDGFGDTVRNPWA